MQVVDRRPRSPPIVNIGDDIVLHGLHISPDLDTVTYTLAGAINPETGWGLAGETWQAMDDRSARYGGDARGSTSATATSARTCTARRRLDEGATLTEVTAEIAAAWGLGLRLLPVTDDRASRHDGRPSRARARSASRSTSSDASTACRSRPCASTASSEPSPRPGVLDAIAGAERS